MDNGGGDHHNSGVSLLHRLFRRFLASWSPRFGLECCWTSEAWTWRWSVQYDNMSTYFVTITKLYFYLWGVQSNFWVE
jgi:hypothetical protein